LIARSQPKARPRQSLDLTPLPVALSASTEGPRSAVLETLAAARKLGLVAEYRETAFEAIIPSVRVADFNVGMSSFTDTKERESAADFGNYFRAGTLWAQRTGSSVDPNDACGLRIGVTYASIQETEEIPAKSDACVEAGKPAIRRWSMCARTI
jgi:ABC-type amino acid transport substrate-binding protein